MKKIISLNKDWQFEEKGTSSTINLPHTWNNVDGQDGGNDYFRGVCYYEKHFTCENSGNEKVFLEFKGVANSCSVSLNGQTLCRHDGGFSTFRVDITDHLQKENQLKITVDNSDNTTVYPQKADFTFYGGIYRDVNLIIVPEEHFELAYMGTPAIKVTPVVHLDKRSATVTVETWQNAEEVTVEVNGQTQTVKSENGKAVATFEIENVHLWDGLADPYLYKATATLASGDVVSTRFGCRKMEIDADKGFFLNGKSYPLRGVAKHQDFKGLGNAITLEQMQQDMAIIKELGANTLRLAHYQHAQEFYDLCDENGIVVWAEIPYITMHMEQGRSNTLTQMEELVVQNYNHPCIAVWGLSNEITSATPVNDDLLENHTLLNDLCHKLDSTRLTTMANVFMLGTDSPILDIPDVNSYNLYYGWYLGELNENEEFFDKYHAEHPTRPMGFSEYGADANPNLHSEHPEKGDYTEEYQCVYHEHMIDMIEKRPYLWATHVWNLFDFGADGRDEGGKHGENQKGLVTFDRQTKKDAFYLYKAHWSKEPFVHICGKRFIDHKNKKVQIKVYSNQKEVSLYKDGKLVETKQGEYVFTFDLTIWKKHKLVAKSGNLCDERTIKKVWKENKTYRLQKAAPVVNWFDQNIQEGYYSVADKISDIRKHPEAGALITKMMEEGAKNYGDVAKAAMKNPILVKMMGKMSLLSLMKQANMDEEKIKEMNRILQKYKKVD